MYSLSRQKDGKGMKATGSLKMCVWSGCEPTDDGSSDVPAVNNDGTAEEVLESVDAAPQFQQELRLLWHAVVRPAHELNVGHLPLGVLLPLLRTRAPAHKEVRKHTGALAR